MRKILVGRDSSCDHIILDPKRSVSRQHCILYNENGRYFIEDTSSNGTFINGKRIEKGVKISLNLLDNIRLSGTYPLNLDQIFEANSEHTRILNTARQSDINDAHAEKTFIYHDGDKRVEFNADKTSLGELSELDRTSFKTIGRLTDNDIVINDAQVSRKHGKIRLLFPQVIEIIDLDSTNGTFADGMRLASNKSYRFDTNVTIKLGTHHVFSIRNHFPEAIIVPKAIPRPQIESNPKVQPPSTSSEITADEKKRFLELKALWEDYQQRQSKAGNLLNGYSIGGAALGIVAAALTGGAGALIFASGGGLLGRYLGQQKSNEIRQDLTYEDMFLQTYSCPRCQESFQRRPWITIRDCFKCKIKFR
jgi:pSer/pThr/pTyr-binding forkhead associated (FHA) protein